MSEMKCKRCGADEMTDFTKEFIAEARESITEPGVERYICIPVQLEMLDEIERIQSRIAELETEKECEMRVFKDGNAWCFVLPDFQDLQVSSSVWMKEGALDKIYKELRSVRNE